MLPLQLWVEVGIQLKESDSITLGVREYSKKPRYELLLLKNEKY
jgi:hypothetical protein